MSSSSIAWSSTTLARSCRLPPSDDNFKGGCPNIFFYVKILLFQHWSTKDALSKGRAPLLCSQSESKSCESTQGAKEHTSDVVVACLYLLR